MKQFMAKVLKNQPLTEDVFLLRLHAPQMFGEGVPTPGQFVNIGVGDGQRLLRRPISIHDADAGEKTVDLAIRAVGRGTGRIAKIKEGDEIDTVGPLGHGFAVSDSDKRIYLVGGGMGVAPLCYAAKAFSPGREMRAFMGFRSAAHMHSHEGLGVPVTVVTDDGSFGEKLMVTELLRRAIGEARPDLVLCCGPNPMLRALQQVCKSQDVPCQISIEQRMACGVGGCLTCNCKVRAAGGEFRYVRACVEGPVFRGEDVILDGT